MASSQFQIGVSGWCCGGLRNVEFQDRLTFGSIDAAAEELAVQATALAVRSVFKMSRDLEAATKLPAEDGRCLLRAPDATAGASPA